MNRAFCVMTIGLTFGLTVFAQSTPKGDLFLGYSLLRANSARNIPAFSNNGGVGTFGWNLSDYFGAEAEIGGYHNGNISGVQFDTTTMTYLFGPRASLGRSKRASPYLHSLFGGIHATTSLATPAVVNPLGQVTTPAGRVAASQDAFAMALGGGMDVRVTKSFSIRPIQLDYMWTRLEDFGGSGQITRNQHNLRYAAGVTFTFGAR